MKITLALLWSVPLIAATTISGTAQVNSPKNGGISFRKQVLNNTFVSEGVAVADINKDGKKDIIAGAYWFEAPRWTQHELAAPQAFEFDKGYSNAFLNFALDVNLDGWMDIIRVDFPGKAVVWHENPKNAAGHWKEHPIYHSFGNETPRFVDMDGDGRPDLIGNDSEGKEVIWLKAPVKKGDTIWKKFTVSSDKNLGTHQFTHGLGAEDLNGDGRRDVLINKGWWEAPTSPSSENWSFHASNFGDDCSQMYVMDVNGDGLKDVISSSAHNYGIWWHEQKKSSSGEIGWIKHLIDNKFSQTHSLILKDMNKDGHPDLVTGKRFFAHNGNDPGAREPAVLYWYEYMPNKAPFWKAHQIDDNSGVGLGFVVEDVNGDGLQDVVVSNKKGVHYFQQKSKGK